MERFKIGMGFPMLATAIWLFSLAANKFGKSGALYLGLLLVILGFAAWLYGEFVQRGSVRRGLAGGFAVAMAIAGFFIFTRGVRAETDAIAWQKWTPEAVQTARAKGQPVIVDFTADWCITCKCAWPCTTAWAVFPTMRRHLPRASISSCSPPRTC